MFSSKKASNNKRKKYKHKKNYNFKESYHKSQEKKPHLFPDLFLEKKNEPTKRISMEIGNFIGQKVSYSKAQPNNYPDSNEKYSNYCKYNGKKKHTAHIQNKIKLEPEDNKKFLEDSRDDSTGEIEIELNLASSLQLLLDGFIPLENSIDNSFTTNVYHRLERICSNYGKNVNSIKVVTPLTMQATPQLAHTNHKNMPLFITDNAPKRNYDNMNQRIFDKNINEKHNCLFKPFSNEKNIPLNFNETELIKANLNDQKLMAGRFNNNHFLPFNYGNKVAENNDRSMFFDFGFQNDTNNTNKFDIYKERINTDSTNYFDLNFSKSKEKSNFFPKTSNLPMFNLMNKPKINTSHSRIFEPEKENCIRHNKIDREVNLENLFMPKANANENTFFNQEVFTRNTTEARQHNAEEMENMQNSRGHIATSKSKVLQLEDCFYRLSPIYRIPNK